MENYKIQELLKIVDALQAEISILTDWCSQLTEKVEALENRR